MNHLMATSLTNESPNGYIPDFVLWVGQQVAVEQAAESVHVQRLHVALLAHSADKKPTIK